MSKRIDIGAVYYGRDGWLAKVLDVEGGSVVMERWRINSKYTVKFRIPAAYLLSGLGWREEPYSGDTRRRAI